MTKKATSSDDHTSSDDSTINEIVPPLISGLEDGGPPMLEGHNTYQIHICTVKCNDAYTFGGSNVSQMFPNTTSLLQTVWHCLQEGMTSQWRQSPALPLMKSRK